jgi:membrane-bound lytic murein transglycosylase F
VAPPARHAPAAFLETAVVFAVAASVFLMVLWESGFQPTDRFYIKDWNKSTAYLEKILKKREITLITQNTTRSYYLYREEAMGFEYDLAKAFADYLGVGLTVELADDWQGMLSKLEETPTGFIAAGIPILTSRSTRATFSQSYLTTRQHIIVHRDNRQITSPEDLSGRTVHVGKDSVATETLETLLAQGIDVKVVFDEDASTEELILRVSEKTIDMTIADSYVAFLSRRYYPQVVVSGAISKESTELGWAVDPGAEGLLNQINLFFRTIQTDGRFAEILARTYADVEEFDFVDLRAYHRRLKSRLPKYETLIQSAAETYGFDWRLIAAQVYQESHFNPRARSHAGAYGLMQLTKKTARHFGVDDIYDPEENIRAGVRHLRYLYDRFDGAEGLDRMYIALAAYNIGQGHILDARRLAVQQGLDPNKWADLSKTLPLLREAQYYKLAEYGYCRGEEPVTYVRQIMLYYDILRYQDMPWVTADRKGAVKKG